MVTGSLMPVSLPHAVREDTAQGSECLGPAPKAREATTPLPQAESNGGQGGWGEGGAVPWASGQGCQGRTSRWGSQPRPDAVFSSGKQGRQPLDLLRRKCIRGPAQEEGRSFPLEGL